MRVGKTISKISKHLRGTGETLVDKFWSRVDKLNHPHGCWIWLGATYRNGYGMASLNRRPCRAHRLAFFFTHGAMPNQMILHSCDNRKCVNPEHLREGTHEENMLDMEVRNRTARGEDLPQSKLSVDNVREVRNLLAGGLTQAVIAQKFGVHQCSISDIHKRKSWAHVI